MLFSLVTPEKKIVTEHEVDEIVVPGELGEFDILPGHSPIVSTLKEGILRYRPKGASKMEGVSISWGYCEVNPHGVMIMVETAESADELDEDRVLSAKKLAETKLKEGRTIGDVLKYQRKLRRAQTRLELLKKFSKN